MHGLVFLLGLPCAFGLALPPASTSELVNAAARSIRSAMQSGLNRQSIELFIPLEPTVKPEDLDPWPGGLRQMSQTAVPIARAILKQVVPGCEIVEAAVSADDAVTQLQAQAAAAADDAVVVVFASPDHLDALRAIDAAAGERLVVLFNAQFDSQADLGFFKRNDARNAELWGPSKSLKQGRFPLTYCAQQLSVRSEDVRLCYDHGAGWRAFVVEDNVFDGQSLVADGVSAPLHEGTLDARPDYKELERLVIAKLPSPVYMRRLKDATNLGPRFNRKE
ncbi:hypothetical protein M885DRAFT_521753 [Pelagophyceae sp. CCMP2097]|nr:hypothetical protein M885DRAFT_521753 [Pelagophyceae sp. CCMP2097]